MEDSPGDDRALSEATGIALLVGVTVVVTATAGLNVLVVDQEPSGPPDANFSYDYDAGSSTMVVTHDGGDEFPAGELVIASERAEATWAAVANVNASRAVAPGDAVQISRNNAYGRPVTGSTTVTVYHETNGTRTELSSWPADA